MEDSHIRSSIGPADIALPPTSSVQVPITPRTSTETEPRHAQPYPAGLAELNCGKWRSGEQAACAVGRHRMVRRLRVMYPTLVRWREPRIGRRRVCCSRVGPSAFARRHHG